MKILLHDLPAETAAGMVEDDMLVYAAQDVKAHCVGCFGCWVKTPGRCVMRDSITELPAQISQSSDLIVISRCYLGGYSPDMKHIIDRLIPYILPFFRIVEGEMHHTMRYAHDLRMHALFYGAAPEEEPIARDLLRGNALNYGAAGHSIRFFEDIASMKGAELCVSC